MTNPLPETRVERVRDGELIGWDTDLDVIEAQLNSDVIDSLLDSDSDEIRDELVYFVDNNMVSADEYPY